MKAIQEAIAELDGKITELTAARDALLVISPRAEMAAADLSQATRPPAMKRMNKRRAGLPATVERKPAKGGKRKASSVAPHPDPLPIAPQRGEGDEKPTTLGGAMKFLGKRFKKPFSMQDMAEALKADPDFEKVLAECGPGALYANLAYWAKTGKLDKAGEGADARFTVVNLDF